MKTKLNLLALAVATTLSLSVASCQKAGNTSTASNQAGNTVAVNANSTSNAVAPVAGNSTATPTDAYKAAYAARKNKDVPALKKLMSKDIIEFFTELGGMGDKKQTIDELLMDLCEKPQAPTAEARNEKIDGDTATIEYLDEKGGWSTMDFVKEDGGWKLTIAKMDEPASDDKDKKEKK